MSAPAISLPQFEGPLDLLLDLVRRHQVEISEIPLAAITGQYLDYMRQARERDIDLGGEFAYIAALLIQIKSRSLLASPDELGPQEDPRQELVDLLLEHERSREQMRLGTEFLRARLEASGAVYTRDSIRDFDDAEIEPPADPSLTLLDLLRLTRQALDTASFYREALPETGKATVEEMQEWIARRLAPEDAAIDARLILEEHEGRFERAVVFLAMLELSRTGSVDLQQKVGFGAAPIKWRECA